MTMAQLYDSTEGGYLLKITQFYVAKENRWNRLFLQHKEKKYRLTRAIF